MLKKDEGIVLKTRRSGETSRVVTFLGSKSGKMRLMAKGAMGEKSPLKGALEAGTFLEVVYYFKEGRDLYYLKEAFVRSRGVKRRDSLLEMACVLSSLELIDRVCYAGGPAEKLVGLLVDYLGCEEASDPLFLFLAFEVKALGALGALPDFFTCSACGKPFSRGYFDPKAAVGFCGKDDPGSTENFPLSEEVIVLLEKSEGLDLSRLSSLPASRRARKNLGKLIHSIYTYHVQGYRFPSALKLLK